MSALDEPTAMEATVAAQQGHRPMVTGFDAPSQRPRQKPKRPQTALDHLVDVAQTFCGV